MLSPRLESALLPGGPDTIFCVKPAPRAEVKLAVFPLTGATLARGASAVPDLMRQITSCLSLLTAELLQPEAAFSAGRSFFFGFAPVGPNYLGADQI